jgi:hypothetical protein
MRRVSLTGPARRECAVARRLYRAGLPVPQPIAHLVLTGNAGRFTEAHLTSDLGHLTPVMSYAKGLRDSSRNDDLITLEDEIIGVTQSMIRLGVLDIDHSVVNLMVTPAGRLVRIDFEAARVVRFPSLHPGLLGGMIGRLVASYVFTHQPNVERVERFASRLLQRTRPSARALRRARSVIDQALARQRREIGLSTSFSLPS